MVGELESFEERAVRRYVRDLGNVFSNCSGELHFYTGYDWPMIEEVRAWSYKPDQRVVLLTRDVFDYITRLQQQGVDTLKKFFEASNEETAKPQKFEHVTYGSDVSELVVPFNPKERHFLLYSKSRNGKKLFTAGISSGIPGYREFVVKMTAPSSKIGKVLMEVRYDLGLPELALEHQARLYSTEFLNDSKLCERAMRDFEKLVCHSGHVV